MLLQGDAAAIPLPDKSVHCIVTSPPYWGLRKYQGDQGRGTFPNLGLEPTPELHIEHMVEIMREVRRVLRDDGTVWLNYGDCYAGSGGGHKDGTGQSGVGAVGWEENKGRMEPRNVDLSQGNLMLMPHRVAIALQADGWIVRNDVVWWKRNPMPESIAGWRFEAQTCDCKKLRAENAIAEHIERTGCGRPRAFQDLRRSGLYDPDPNCSQCHGTGKVGDPVLCKGSWRHTRAHEYIFQLVKGPKMRYYSNQEVVREEFRTDISENYPHRSHILGRGGLESLEQYPGSGPQRRSSGGYPPAGAGRNPRSVLTSSEIRYYELPDGTICIVSEDCPIHGHRQGVQIRQMEFDGEQATFSLSHNEDTGDDHDPEPVSEPLSNSDHNSNQHHHSKKDYQSHENELMRTPGSIDESKKEVSRSDAYGEGVQKSHGNKSIQGSAIYPSADAPPDLGDPVAIDPNKQHHKRRVSSIVPDRVADSEVPHHTDRNGFACSCKWIIPRTHYADVLDVSTQPYSGAHYATFSEKLIAPLIRASCPKQCCPECGAPWAPVVEKGYDDEIARRRHLYEKDTKYHDPKAGYNLEGRANLETKVSDYRPTCSCTVCTICCCKECTCGRDSNRQSPRPVPGICLDPFIGSGTTGAVARELGRRWVGLDISMEYLDQQAKVRALKWTPSNALDDLPLFEGLLDE